MTTAYLLGIPLDGHVRKCTVIIVHLVFQCSIHARTQHHHVKMADSARLSVTDGTHVTARRASRGRTAKHVRRVIPDRDDVKTWRNIVIVFNSAWHYLLNTELFCVSDPCMNGATCQEIGGGTGYTCVCPEAFTGTNCQTRKTIHLVFLPYLSMSAVKREHLNRYCCVCFRVVLRLDTLSERRHMQWRHR